MMQFLLLLCRYHHIIQRACSGGDVGECCCELLVAIAVGVILALDPVLRRSNLFGRPPQRPRQHRNLHVAVCELGFCLRRSEGGGEFSG